MNRMLLSEIKTDCRYFKGSSPCIANKQYGATCGNCNMYDKVDAKILIIKLGAAGDVIRTTPLLHALKRNYPYASIHWLTDYPRFVPLKTAPSADVAYEFNLRSILYLSSIEFDLVINLDKDNEAIALASQLKSIRKAGFVMKDGHCYPADSNAYHKFLTGVDDKFSKLNNKSYMEEIFEICGYRYAGEKYLLDVFPNESPELDIRKSGRIVGLNTGVGERWKSRLWKEDYWIELTGKLQDGGYEVLLLGGSTEHDRNIAIQKATNANYHGTFDLGGFVNLVDKCDLVVTQVTMCMHLAIALNKKLVLMNNIFNRNEFELFGNGVIVEPERECKCYFGSNCRNEEYLCMDHISPERVAEVCFDLLEQNVNQMA